VGLHALLLLRCWASRPIAREKLRFIETSLRNLLAPLISIAVKPSYPAKVSFVPVQLEGEKKGYSDYRKLEKSSLGEEWRQIEGEFFLVAALNLPDVAYDARLAPGVKLCEGAVDIWVVRSKVRRLDILMAFLQVETGGHVLSGTTESYKVNRLIIEPKFDGGWTSLSGELIPSQKLDLLVHTAAVNFMCKPTNL